MEYVLQFLLIVIR